jgi:hypothetical protein
VDEIYIVVILTELTAKCKQQLGEPSRGEEEIVRVHVVETSN